MADILILAGPSGVGKTTLLRALQKEIEIPNLTSYTTREERDTDLPGEYTYVSQAEFDQMRSDKVFLWHVDHGGTCYGTRRLDVCNACEEPTVPHAMILVPKMVVTLHEFVTDYYRRTKIVPIFLTSPGERLLRERMRERGATEEFIRRRLDLEENWTRTAINSPIKFRLMPAGRDLSELPAAVTRVRQELGR